MNDKFTSQTILNAELKNKIFETLPRNYNKMEIAIYLYIKLAQIFSYDSEYYIFDGDKKIAQKHETIVNLEKFNQQNNEIICYEFTALYAKLLEMFEIEFKVKYKKDIEHFGGQHTNLTFFYDDFEIYADSVTSILDGDLFRSKIGLDLVGILCKNDNASMQNTFLSTLTSVYKSLNDSKLLTYFYELANKSMLLNGSEKIFLIADLSNKYFSSCMDKISLMLFLKKVLFLPDNYNNCDMLIVKNNNKNYRNNVLKKEQLAFPSIIITLNEKFYIYTPGDILSKTTADDLKELFENGNLEYKVDNPKRLKLI